MCAGLPSGAHRGYRALVSRLQAFRADIQGLRAVAIVPVVLYHALGDWVPGGFAGVDVFFVISGFLITRILMREIEAGSFSIAGFYARRVRRLFPALFAMLAATLAAGLVLLPPQPPAVDEPDDRQRHRHPRHAGDAQARGREQ